MIELFCRRWCLGKQHRWIAHVEYAKNLFSKDIHNINQIEEANDLSSTVDEAPHADKYDCGPTYEYSEVLVEEVEEQKERVRSHFRQQFLMTSRISWNIMTKIL